MKNIVDVSETCLLPGTRLRAYGRNAPGQGMSGRE